MQKVTNSQTQVCNLPASQQNQVQLFTIIKQNKEHFLEVVHSVSQVFSCDDIPSFYMSS